jgi:hypothetical protein
MTGFAFPWLVLAILAAGCVGSQATPASVASQTPGENGVRGMVISDELFPVAGANVSVKGGPWTLSDASGRFVLSDVAAGRVVLSAGADGYKPSQQEVEVLAVGFVDVQVTMSGIPGQAPYVRLLIHDGFVACSYSIVYSAGWPDAGPPVGRPPCPLGAGKDSYRTEVGPDWRAGVHEMAWKGQEEMIFASSLDHPGCGVSANSHTHCPAMIWGRSPQRIFARPEDKAYAARHAIAPEEVWPKGNYTSYLSTGYSGYLRTEVNQTLYTPCSIIDGQFGVPKSWGCPFGIGLSTGIRFQFYHTTFYLQTPVDLESFSAQRDG